LIEEGLAEAAYATTVRIVYRGTSWHDKTAIALANKLARIIWALWWHSRLALGVLPDFYAIAPSVTYPSE